jgi:AcrR family transcriptional regulator
MLPPGYNRKSPYHPFSDLAVSCNEGHSVPMASKIEAKILDAGIVLFADYGYYGVTTRDLARKAKVTEGSIYRIFQNKEKLFDRCLDAVVGHVLDPAQLLLLIFENRKQQDFYSAIIGPVCRWYASLTRHSARLMLQACLCHNEHWRKTANLPLEKTIDILAGSLEREITNPGSENFNTKIVARSLVVQLFQLKAGVPLPCSAKEEAAQRDGILEHWLNGLKQVISS